MAGGAAYAYDTAHSPAPDHRGRRPRPARGDAGVLPVLGLQRSAGNAAVAAVLGRAVQREAAPAKADPTLERFVSQVVDKVDDDDYDKVFLATVLAGAKYDARQFAALLTARTSKQHGNYFTGMVRLLEDGLGSRAALGMLGVFAGRGVDVQTAVVAPSLQPMAVIAGFKALLVTYNELRAAGKVSREDQVRVAAAASAVADVLRPIEAKRAKGGVRVQVAGGAATAAGVLWRSAAALAADDVTGIGVADDVIIPFVVVGAAVLGAVALIAGSAPPEILDYAPAQQAARAAVQLMQQVVSRPVPIAPPMPPPMPPLELGKRDKPKKPGKQTEPTPGRTAEPVPLEPADRKRREKTYVMRFQVQWATRHGGPTFGEPAVAEYAPGVTVAQALAALATAVGKTTPRAAQEAAAPAVAKQRKYIAAQPATGGLPDGVGRSRSVYFPYERYTDARVDVENLLGHNLRV